MPAPIAHPHAAPPVAFVRDLAGASALLDPLRLRLLDALRHPESAAGLARRFRLPRQRVNYHVRALARAGFLRRAGTRRRRNMLEQRYVASARAWVLSPELLGRVGAEPGAFADAFSAAYLVALLVRAQGDLARVTGAARAQGKRLATMSLSAEFRFESAEQRATFARALQQAVLDAVGKHASAFTTADGAPVHSRPYRLVLGCYPAPPRETHVVHEKETAQ